ncbi:uncharacterized protein LOC130649709 isoform X2 [Hydractinia symbiolongicarpus]|uniref:uncharacterized protein LOC130649709 isoform X2 n=1 Tax=Hydractinia symbiolongicarpus TaxID=13093 RepID=UPI00254A079E|nr:uncharacterized protein LOC130649709 isoform X2 [Hydractinia symbiolongicarpus]
MVKNLARHLLLCHKWSKASADAAIGQFGLRRQTQKTLQKKDYHTSRICPVEGCYKVLKRLPKHLRKFHKIENKEKYRALLDSAVMCNSIQIIGVVDSSPRKVFQNIKSKSLADSKQKSFSKTSLPAAEQMIVPIADNAESDQVTHAFTSIPRRELPVHSVDLITSKSRSQSPLLFSDSDGSEFALDCDDIENTLPNEVKELFEKFAAYLQGPDGGNRTSFEQIVEDVKRIYLIVCANKDLAMFFDGQHFRDEYLAKHCKSRENLPGIIKKYLSSVGVFCEFLITERVQLTSVGPEKVVDLKRKLNVWKKSYKKLDKERRFEREIDDHSMLVTPQQLQNYEKSENAVNAKSFFLKLQSSDFSVTQAEYCCMRDHLFSVIHFANGHRSGVSANLLVSEVDACQRVDGLCQISVKQHKTAYAYGPATITMSEIEFGWLKLFTDKIRPQVKPKCRNVFLSWTGSAMTSGQISLRIHQLWAKADLFGNVPIKNLSCNIIRKSTTTGIRGKGMGMNQEVADLMCHSLDTANKHYFVRKKQEAAAKGGKVIRSYFRENENISSSPPASPRHKWKIEDINKLQEAFADEIGKKEINIENRQLAVPNRLNSASASTQSISTNIGTSNQEDNAAEVTSSMAFNVRKRKRLFSDADLKIIHKKCKGIIAGGPITEDCIREALDGKLSHYNYMQLRTRLDYEKKLRK